MPRISPQLGEAVKAVLAEKGWSYRRASIATGLQHATIGAMASGIVPGKDHIINWAVALNEPINKWLELAGYDRLPANLVIEQPELWDWLVDASGDVTAEARFSDQFGKMVKEIIGEDSYSQASARTQISEANLMQMVQGRIPSEANIRKFAEAYSDRKPDLHALLDAGEYFDPLKRVTIALNGAKNISDLSKQMILDAVRDILDRYDGEQKNNTNDEH